MVEGASERIPVIPLRYRIKGALPQCCSFGDQSVREREATRQSYLGSSVVMDCIKRQVGVTHAQIAP